MLVAIERISWGVVLLLTLLAAGLSTGPKPRRWISDYMAAVFTPAAVDPLQTTTG